MGRVPLYPGTKDERYPGVSSWESLEHIGPMSRTVADSALMLSVISGPDSRDRYSLPKADFDWMGVLKGGVKGLKVAYSPDWGYAPVDPEVRRVVGEAVKVFERDLGCIVEEAHPGFEDPYGAFWAIVAMETDLRGMREIVAKYGHHMTPHLVDFFNHHDPEQIVNIDTLVDAYWDQPEELMKMLYQNYNVNFFILIEYEHEHPTIIIDGQPRAVSFGRCGVLGVASHTVYPENGEARWPLQGDYTEAITLADQRVTAFRWYYPGSILGTNERMPS